MPNPERMPLAQAAIELGLTYHQVRDRVLRGDLAGGRDELGRYYVERQAVQAARRSTAPRHRQRQSPRSQG